jgi:septin family protein
MQTDTPLPPAGRLQPTVLLIIGKSGSGKTTLANMLLGESAGRMAILKPTASLRALFDHEQDWDNCDVLAVDEVRHWDPASLRVGVARLEDEATQRGKKLILILQGQDELERRGIVLRAEPSVLRIPGPGAQATLTYKGKTCNWP